MSNRAWMEMFLSPADIKIGGNRPWDILVHDERFFSRVLKHGSLGLGEAYMDGWWDSEALDETFARVFRAQIARKLPRSPETVFLSAYALLFNLQRRDRSFMVGERHYDVGNDLYREMLGRTMAYTCGYWKNTASLDQAQEQKYDLVCRKIGLTAGDRILDVGCGWGGFAQYAAKQYGASVVGVTVSKEQAVLGKSLCQGLDVDIRLQDYREAEGVFDHIVSIGLFEHVGYKNYRPFFLQMSKHLKDDGFFLLHTIGSSVSVRHTDPWIEKYIFPNGMLPSIAQIGEASEGILVMEDWHNFGADYDKTLMEWFRNFDRAWPRLREKYGDHFYRMWKYYLLACAGNFRSRRIQLWQVMLSKNGVLGGYFSIR